MSGMNVYTPQDIPSVAARVYEVMTQINPEWKWSQKGQGLMPVTIEMIEEALMRHWNYFTREMRRRRLYDESGYESGLVESGGIACKLGWEGSGSGHGMAVYVRVGTI